MRTLLYLLCLFALPVMAADELSLKNDREGTSYYSSGSDKRAASRALKKVESHIIVDAFQDSLRETDLSKVCAYDLNASLFKKLKTQNPKFDEMEGAILVLRNENQIDDISTKLLLSANEVASTEVILPKNEEELYLPADEKVVDAAVTAIGNFEKKGKTLCFDDAFKTVYGEILKVNKDIKSEHIEALLVEAYQRKVISYESYLMLERGRMNDLQNTALSLKTYLKKIRSLRTQFPLRDPGEKSNFVTKKSDKLKMSHRQRLMENYTDIQIMLMANVIKKLRVRLESPKAEILIYDRNQGVETIPLEPMERFRLAIKLLRKEMSLLALNTYFAGRTPGYIDLMTAAYETGTIPASELEEVAGLEDIWNPKKTFWQKAKVWASSLSGIATLVIPPPYGFIPALAVVVIEMTSGKKDDKTEDPTVLF